MFVLLVTTKLKKFINTIYLHLSLSFVSSIVSLNKNTIILLLRIYTFMIAIRVKIVTVNTGLPLPLYTGAVNILENIHFELSERL